MGRCVLFARKSSIDHDFPATPRFKAPADIRCGQGDRIRESYDKSIGQFMVDPEIVHASRDSAAAYRYTEARMAAVAEEMLNDIEKGTVDLVPF